MEAEEERQRSIYEVLFEEEFLHPDVIEGLFQSARGTLLPLVESEVKVLKDVLRVVDVGAMSTGRDASVMDLPIAGIDGSINGDNLLGVFYALLSASVVSYRNYEDPDPTVICRALALGFPPERGSAMRKAVLRRVLMEAEMGVEFLKESTRLPAFLFLDGPLVPSSRLLPLHSWVSYGRMVWMRDDAEYTKMFEDYLGKEDEKKVSALLNFYNLARERGVILIGIVKTPCTWSILIDNEEELKKVGLNVKEVRKHGIYDRLLVEFAGYEFLEKNPDKIFYTEPIPSGERPIFPFAYGFRNGETYRTLKKDDIYSLYVKTHLNGTPIRVEVFREVAQNKELLEKIVNLLYFTGVPYPRGTWPVIYVPSPILAAHDKCTVKNPTLGLIDEDLRNRSVKQLGDVGDLITRPTWVSWLLFRSWSR